MSKITHGRNLIGTGFSTAAILRLFKPARLRPPAIPGETRPGGDTASQRRRSSTGHGGAPGFRGQAASAKKPEITDYATIEGWLGKDQVPVYAFGYTYVYGRQPDLLPGAVMQQGNSNPADEDQAEEIMEIESSVCGSTPAREPKTMQNDDQPLLPFHLIDGDSETCWSTRLNAQPDRNQNGFASTFPPRRKLLRSRLCAAKKVQPRLTALWEPSLASCCEGSYDQAGPRRERLENRLRNKNV